MKELKADEVVTAIEDSCEMQKLLNAGIQPLVAIIEEVCQVASLKECTEYNPEKDILLESENGVTVLRLNEFARVIDIMFQLVEPHEKHVHEEE